MNIRLKVNVTTGGDGILPAVFSRDAAIAKGLNPRKVLVRKGTVVPAARAYSWDGALAAVLISVYVNGLPLFVVVQADQLEVIDEG